MEEKPNHLLELCHPLFNLANAFQQPDQLKNLDETYRTKIENAFHALEHQALESTLQHLKYALAAFIDEFALRTDWPGRSAWMSRPLQLEFFAEHLAGEGFFTRLTKLRQQGTQSTDLLEIYFLCLQFGFEGIYRLRGHEKLQALQIELYAQIQQARGNVDVRLTPQAISHAPLQQKKTQKLSWRTTIISITISAIIVYSVFFLLANQQATQALEKSNEHFHFSQ